MMAELYYNQNKTLEFLESFTRWSAKTIQKMAKEGAAIINAQQSS